MSFTEQIITVAMCVLGTYLMRALPFAVFTEKRETPKFVRYLGNALPSAIFAMLVVYCFKDVSFLSEHHAAPEIIAGLFTIFLHLRRRQMLLSIAGGTAVYMILVQFVFV